jgi:hypothetical protein
MLRALRARVSDWGVVQGLYRLRRDRRQAREAGTTAVRRAAVRLLIGPVNSAGQGFAWARAAERMPEVAAADFMYRDPGDVFAYPADHAVGTVLFRTNAAWQRAQHRAVLRRFTHVIVESGRQLVGTEGSVRDQIDAMVAHGIRVALVFHGSDLRRPSSHAAREKDSPFRDGAYPDTARLEEITTRNHALALETGLPVFVSTPDLLTELPGATWLPVVVDVAAWSSAAERPALARRRLVVVHAPSNGGLKGSALITDAMRRLHDEGVVDYREVRGIAAADMPGVYGDADIVLDQFALGIYGVAACEAMAAGRLVVGHVARGKRRVVRAHTGLDLPIVEARAAHLEGVLRDIASDPTAYTEFTRRGPDFVREVHDGRRSAAALRCFLGSGAEVPPRSDVED